MKTVPIQDNSPRDKKAGNTFADSSRYIIIAIIIAFCVMVGLQASTADKTTAFSVQSAVLQMPVSPASPVHVPVNSSHVQEEESYSAEIPVTVRLIEKNIFTAIVRYPALSSTGDDYRFLPERPPQSPFI